MPGMGDQTVEIHLTLSIDGNTLTGQARGESGEMRRFDGRLGLLAAIDALTANEPEVTSR
jgi:hypothetical protein